MVLTKNSTGLNLSFMLKKSESELPLGAKVKADEVLRSGEKREVYPRTWCTLKQGQKSQMLPFRKIVTAGGTVNEDEITLQCEVCMQCIVQDELLVGEIAEPKVDLFRCLEEMLHKEVHTDFELRAGGTVTKAHKSLLAVRSPYFAAMLQPHTKEAQEGFVEVSDVKPEVLKQVLVYMYTAEAPGLKDKPWDLLMAADKYQLPQLKRQCEAYIASRLDVDNAAETAANAFVFSSDLLLQRAVHFIKRNLSQVISTPGWNEAIAAYPEAIQSISEMIE
ncbi:speckle-type POZ protein-like [Schistocerca nitens]|uniref:speckle-type POZ protein-like n=1 Tax=Schistocerca nitens TaxID=7011 RepID=UPI0021183959|nr:speckle-type POZ protein-like [Schistocerca nitens]